MSYSIRRAVAEDVTKLAPIMRDYDRQEVWASSAKTPLQALQAGFDLSVETFTSLADDVPLFMYGVAPFTLLGQTGTPWLLTSQDITNHRHHLMRWSKPVLHYWSREMFPYLFNMVDARHTPALTWAKYIGFTVYPAQPFGPFKMPFHKIELRRKNV